MKTASTSVEIFLEEFCTDRPRHYEDGQEYRYSEESRQGVIAARQNFSPEERPTFYNHMPLGALKKILPKDMLDRYRVITSVRNPYDVLLSRFFWEMPERDRVDNVQRPHDKLLLEFNRFVFSIVESFNEEIYLDPAGEVEVDMFIRYESMKSDLRNVLLFLGLDKDVASLQHFKGNSRPRDLRYHELENWYSKDTVAHVEAVFSGELRRFGYSLA